MSLIYPSDDFYPASQRRSRLGPFIIGAALATIALAGQTRLGAWLRGFFAPPPSPYDDNVVRQVRAGLSLPQLRSCLLGQNMARVVSTLGPPRTVTTGPSRISAVTDAGPGSFWRSDTWYYPLDTRTQTAMAIRFTAGIAQQVDFFQLSAPIET